MFFYKNKYNTIISVTFYTILCNNANLLELTDGLSNWLFFLNKRLILQFNYTDILFRWSGFNLPIIDSSYFIIIQQLRYRLKLTEPYYNKHRLVMFSVDILNVDCTAVFLSTDLYRHFTYYIIKFFTKFGYSVGICGIVFGFTTATIDLYKYNTNTIVPYDQTTFIDIDGDFISTISYISSVWLYRKLNTFKFDIIRNVDINRQDIVANLTYTYWQYNINNILNNVYMNYQPYVNIRIDNIIRDRYTYSWDEVQPVLYNTFTSILTIFARFIIILRNRIGIESCVTTRWFIMLLYIFMLQLYIVYHIRLDTRFKLHFLKSLSDVNLYNIDGISIDELLFKTRLNDLLDTITSTLGYEVTVILFNRCILDCNGLFYDMFNFEFKITFNFITYKSHFNKQNCTNIDTYLRFLILLQRWSKYTLINITPHTVTTFTELNITNLICYIVTYCIQLFEFIKCNDTRINTFVDITYISLNCAYNYTTDYYNLMKSYCIDSYTSFYNYCMVHNVSDYFRNNLYNIYVDDTFKYISYTPSDTTIQTTEDINMVTVDDNIVFSNIIDDSMIDVIAEQCTALVDVRYYNRELCNISDLIHTVNYSITTNESNIVLDRTNYSTVELICINITVISYINSIIDSMSIVQLDNFTFGGYVVHFIDTYTYMQQFNYFQFVRTYITDITTVMAESVTGSCDIYNNVDTFEFNELTYVVCDLMMTDDYIEVANINTSTDIQKITNDNYYSRFELDSSISHDTCIDYSNVVDMCNDTVVDTTVLNVLNHGGLVGNIYEPNYVLNRLSTLPREIIYIKFDDQIISDIGWHHVVQDEHFNLYYGILNFSMIDYRNMINPQVILHYLIILQLRLSGIIDIHHELYLKKRTELLNCGMLNYINSVLANITDIPTLAFARDGSIVEVPSSIGFRNYDLVQVSDDDTIAVNSVEFLQKLIRTLQQPRNYSRLLINTNNLFNVDKLIDITHDSNQRPVGYIDNSTFIKLFGLRDFINKLYHVSARLQVDDYNTRWRLYALESAHTSNVTLETVSSLNAIYNYKLLSAEQVSELLNQFEIDVGRYGIDHVLTTPVDTAVSGFARFKYHEFGHTDISTDVDDESDFDVIEL